MKKIDNEKVTESVNAAKEMAANTTNEAKKLAKKAGKKTREVTETAKKTAKKNYTKLALKETYIQFAGREFKESEILEKVQQAFVNDGYKVTGIKTLELYVKPEDNAAYYVINGNYTGKVDL